MIRDCACGEPLVDSVRKCPQCGRANRDYRPSRWMIFWPSVDSLEGAEEAIRLGYWAAFVVAVLGAVSVALSAMQGGTLLGLLDTAIFATCGLGIRRRWRSAAMLGFLLFAANVALSIVGGQGVGVLAVFVFVGFLNALRGTFAYVSLGRVRSVGRETGANI